MPANVDCIIVHYGDPGQTAMLARSLATRPATNIWCVDNADNFTSELPASCCVVQPADNLGFAAGVNEGARHGSAEWLLLVNPDVTLFPADVDRLIDALAAAPDLALVGPKLVYPDGRPQLNGGAFSGWISELVRSTGRGYLLRSIRGRIQAKGNRTTEEPIARDWVSGTVMLVRRSAFEAVGGFDPKFFLYWEDQDLCRRLRHSGWGVAVIPTVIARHAEGGTSVLDRANMHGAYEHGRAAYHRAHSGRLLRTFVGMTSRRRLAGRELG